jgi:stage II sporulation protein D
LYTYYQLQSSHEGANTMKFLFRLLLWVGLGLALCGLFYAAETEAVPSPALDSASAVTVLAPSPTTMTVADYLPGAVAAEMPASFGLEALKSQAVAIRTYLLTNTHHDSGQVCTDPGCCLAYMDEQALQAYWGDDFAENMALVRQAVAETDGEYLTYQGQPIQAVFHASSAGLTEDSAAVWAAQPYLISVTSPETEDTVPELVTTVTFTPQELAQALDIITDADPSQWLQGVRLTDTGRVRAVLLCGQVYDGTALRAALGLKSTAFTVKWEGDAFVFTVSGSGHGVGLSQQGAKLLAADGLDYRAILAHYYPGTTLEI